MSEEVKKDKVVKKIKTVKKDEESVSNLLESVISLSPSNMVKALTLLVEEIELLKHKNK